MQVPNGWRVMAHCLDALRQAGLFQLSPAACASGDGYSHGEACGGKPSGQGSIAQRILCSMVGSATKSAQSAVRSADRWDGSVQFDSATSSGMSDAHYGQYPNTGTSPEVSLLVCVSARQPSCFVSLREKLASKGK